MRHTIRQAAADLYNNEGPGGVSIRSIAKEAGVSVGTIYTYFGSLQGLMESLWSGSVIRYAEELYGVAQSIEDPLERIRKLMHSYIDFACSNPEIYRGVFLYVRPLKDEVSDKSPAESAVFASLVIQAIKDGQASKVIKSLDPQNMAIMIWAGLHGCIALPNNFSRMQFGDTKEVLNLFVEQTVDGLSA
ncbi:MAG: TetR/AcrR family transcriptional regulator [Pseudomonadota bacterium]